MSKPINTYTIYTSDDRTERAITAFAKRMSEGPHKAIVVLPTVNHFKLFAAQMLKDCPQDGIFYDAIAKSLTWENGSTCNLVSAHRYGRICGMTCDTAILFDFDEYVQPIFTTQMIQVALQRGQVTITHAPESGGARCAIARTIGAPIYAQ